MRADVPQEIAEELDGLAREEPTVADFRDAPVHAERYRALAGEKFTQGRRLLSPKQFQSLMLPCL